MSFFFAKSELETGKSVSGGPSSSAVRAEEAERKVAELEARMASMTASRGPSASTVRAEEAERRAAELVAKIWAKKNSKSSSESDIADIADALNNRESLTKGPSASAIRAEGAERKVAELEARMAQMSTSRGPGASTVRAEEAERKVADLEARMASMARGRGPSASAIRAEEAELRAAELKARMASMSASSGPSASAIRAEGAERKVAELEARMAQMSTSRGPGASTVRAEEAERKVADLEAKLGAMKKGSEPRRASDPKLKACNYIVSTGFCRYGDSCQFAHDGPTVVEALNKRLRDKDRELLAKDKEAKMLMEFSKIRTEMKTKVNGMKSKFAAILAGADSLDLVLCMDLTGSMGSWIASAKDHLCSMVDEVKSEHTNLEVRVGFVGYRDHCDGDRRLVTTPLNTNADIVKEFIRGQNAFGGGDGPEDVTGGLEACLKLQWTAGARAVVLVCDAPCHFSKYNNGDDSAQNLSAARSLYGQEDYIETLVSRFASEGIDFVIIEIVPEETKKMSAILTDVYKHAPKPADGIGRKMSVMPMSGHGDAGKLGLLMTTVAKSSVSDSKLRARATMTAESGKVKGHVGVSSIHHYGPTGLSSKFRLSSRAGLRAIKEDDESDDESASHRLAKLPINWDRLKTRPVERARRCTYLFRPGEAINWESPDLKLVQQETTVRLDVTYFDEGAMRTAHIMYDEGIQRNQVAKVYKPLKVKMDRRKTTIQQDVMAQAVAKQLAIEYSTRPEAPQAVDFIVTSYYELIDRPEKDPFKYVSAEPFIEGEYKKYNNNNGWASAELSHTAQAFSHFTWQFTVGNMMIVDLQGVNYIMTDPQIHTKDNHDTRFGLGNLGMDGMASFFCTHVCNGICDRLSLVSFGRDKGKTAIAAEKGSAVATMDTELDSVAASGTMNLSCTLCGNIYDCERSQFVALIKARRMMYCSPCADKIKSSRLETNCSCSATFDYSPYWYRMIGMEPPKSCKGCKERAAKVVKASSKSK